MSNKIKMPSQITNDNLIRLSSNLTNSSSYSNKLTSSSCSNLTSTNSISSYSNNLTNSSNLIKSITKKENSLTIKNKSHKPLMQLNRFTLNQYRLSIITLLLIIHHSGLCDSLRILNLNVPSVVRNGSAIYLYCDYELAQNEEIYSVKWYKDNVEFYSYLPSNEPYQGKFYRLKGIHVDLHGSNSTHVLLYRMELASEGTYSCEVSTDQFITATAMKQLKILALPQEKLLRIEGSEFEYDVGHLINLTCICPPTYPPSILIWYINGKRAPSNLLVKYPAQVSTNDRLEGAKLGLLFQTRRSDFVNGQLWLKCVASLVLSYRLETIKNLDNIRTESEHRILNERKFFSPSSSGLLLHQKETPVIKGLRANYKQGDTLNLNCTTTARDAQIFWYINDEHVNSNYLIPYTGYLQTNQSNLINQMSTLYESSPHQLNNVYYNNGLSAHALKIKRRTFSIQNSATPTSDNQRLITTGFKRSLALNSQPTYSHLNHNYLSNDLDENQILGLQIPLQQQHFQVDVKLKCVVIMYKQVAQLEQSLKIITENQDFSRMQSSFANNFIGNQQLIHLFFILICLLFNINHV